MNTSPARLGSSILIGAGTILLGAGLWTGFQLRYQATARIKIAGTPSQAEPIWLEKEIPELIRARLAGVHASLNTVVESASLPGDWKNLKPTEAVARLRQTVEIRPVIHTALIEIRVASRNPEEAAQIANQIAGTNVDLPQVQMVDSATPPTQRVFPDLAKGLKLMALGAALGAVGLFVLLDARRPPRLSAPAGTN